MYLAAPHARASPSQHKKEGTANVIVSKRCGNGARRALRVRSAPALICGIVVELNSSDIDPERGMHPRGRHLGGGPRSG